MGTAQPSDAELLARLRSGDGAASAAFALLRERYTRPLGLPVARLADGRLAPLDAMASDAAPPDQQGASERFGPVPLDEVPEGLRGEPREGLDLDERAVVLDAYATLPERMRAVLWLTEVEGRPTGVVGTVLGMTPAAAAALAARARDQLRHAYLRGRLHASSRPRCGRPHPSRLAGYVRHGGRGEARTAAAAHVEGCSSCRALVVAVGDAPRLFALALVSWSASAGRAGSAATAAARPSTSGWRPAGAIAVAVLAAAFLPGRAPIDVASPSPRPAPTEAGLVVPAPHSPPGADPSPAPATTVPGPVAARPTDPPTEAPPSVPPEAFHADADTAATRPSAAPSPVASPTVPAVPDGGTPPTPAGNDDVIDAAASPSVPSVSSAVWQPTSSQVEVTLVNGGLSSTGYLVMTLEAAGGALVAVQPTGCALALGMVTSGVCALRPLVPGASAVVRVPMTVTRPGQSAEVHVCAVGFLRLGCETALARTVVALV